MGNTNSAQQQQREVERQRNHDQYLAINNFNDRVKAYSYPHHGNYEQYIEYCRAQYELDCIPEFCRRGSAYNR